MSTAGELELYFDLSMASQLAVKIVVTVQRGGSAAEISHGVCAEVL